MTPVMARPPKAAARPAKKGRAAAASTPRSAPAEGPVRAQKKLDKRERIRAAAWELFTTEGFEATRTKDVAERAGIATGTLFLYAPDKTDLLCLVMHDRLVETSNEAFLTMPKKASFVDQLLHLFGRLMRMYAEHPKVSLAFVQVVQSADGPNGREVGAMTFGFLHRVAGLVNDAVARGEVDAEIQPVLAAQSIFGLYFFALTNALSGYLPMEAALDPLLRSELELLMRGLSPRGRRTP